MARPKGSKNKPKEEPVKFETKADVLPSVALNQKPPAPKEEWKPSPDMGSIKPPADSEKMCSNVNCRHRKGLHYGGSSEWCNTQGCNCQAFK